MGAARLRPRNVTNTSRDSRKEKLIMSKFYGTVVGSARTEATRRGFSDIRVSAQSWDGSLITRMRYDQGGRLMVQLDKSNESTSCYGRTIFWGTLDELEQKLSGEAAINVEADSFVEAYDKLSCELAKHDDGEITAEDLYMAMCELHDWMAAKIN